MKGIGETSRVDVHAAASDSARTMLQAEVAVPSSSLSNFRNLVSRKGTTTGRGVAIGHRHDQGDRLELAEQRLGRAALIWSQ